MGGQLVAMLCNKKHILGYLSNAKALPDTIAMH
jgi:hypothetical protein